MKIKLIIKSTLHPLLALVFILIFGCSKDSDVQYLEPAKDISGIWQVRQAFRNEENITDLIDFSQFKINFNSDGTYSFENYLPFLINEEGSWTLDDPQYPNFILFSGNSGQEAVKSEVSLPVTDGKRQINLTFSPGCASNTYTYVFERASE
jgi:hypothetical protein